MRHVYLSPHLDDAVLSCGGAMHHRRTAGEPVAVVTVFAQDAPPGSDLSAFARRLHAEWGDLAHPMAVRRAEDAAALALLDVTGQYMDLCDAVYRTGPEGQWLYPDLKALLGGVHPADPVGQEGAGALSGCLAGLIGPPEDVAVYAPLAVGHHVDHQLVHWAGGRLERAGYRLVYYEDFPYAERPGAIEAALASGVDGAHTAEALPLDARDIAAKVMALGYYRSQTAGLFGGEAGMANRVWAFAATCSGHASLAERIWRPR